MGTLSHKGYTWSVTIVGWTFGLFLLSELPEYPTKVHSSRISHSPVSCFGPCLLIGVLPAHFDFLLWVLPLPASTSHWPLYLIVWAESLNCMGSASGICIRVRSPVFLLPCKYPTWQSAVSEILKTAQQPCHVQSIFHCPESSTYHWDHLGLHLPHVFHISCWYFSIFLLSFFLINHNLFCSFSITMSGWLARFMCRLCSNIWSEMCRHVYVFRKAPAIMHCEDEVMANALISSLVEIIQSIEKMCVSVCLDSLVSYPEIALFQVHFKFKLFKRWQWDTSSSSRLNNLYPAFTFILDCHPLLCSPLFLSVVRAFKMKLTNNLNQR